MLMAESLLYHLIFERVNSRGIQEVLFSSMKTLTYEVSSACKNCRVLDGIVADSRIAEMSATP